MIRGLHRALKRRGSDSHLSKSPRSSAVLAPARPLAACEAIAERDAGALRREYPRAPIVFSAEFIRGRGADAGSFLDAEKRLAKSPTREAGCAGPPIVPLRPLYGHRTCDAGCPVRGRSSHGPTMSIAANAVCRADGSVWRPFGGRRAVSGEPLVTTQYDKCRGHAADPL